MQIQNLFFVSAFFIALGAASPSLAQSPVRAELDQSQITLGDEIKLTITIESAGRAEQPNLPAIKDVEVQFAGQSSQYQMINGQVSSSKSFEYVLLPIKAGQYEIPPLSVSIDNKKYTTEVLKFTVMASSSPPRRQNPGATAGNQGSGPAPNADQHNPDFFIDREFSHSEVYVNQPVLMTTRLYFRTQIYEPSLDFQPPSDLQSLDIEGNQQYTKDIDGVQYQVFELRKILKPLQAGKYDVPPVKMKVSYQNRQRRSRDPFDVFSGLNMFRRESRVLITEGFNLNAKPLPKGAPTGFSGLVGEFEIQSSLGQTSVATGDSNTLSIIISGLGFVKDMKAISLPAIPGVKVYPDKPSFTEEPTGNGEITGKAEFRFALIPLQPGKVQLPKLQISTFSPEFKKYVTKELELGSFEATGSNIQSPSAQSPGQSNQNQGGDPTLNEAGQESPLPADKVSWMNMTGSGFTKQLWKNLFWMKTLSILAVILILFFLLFMPWRRQIRDIPTRLRERFRPAPKQELLRVLQSLQSQDGSEQSVQNLFKALQQYLARVLGGETSALTMNEVLQALNPILPDPSQTQTLSPLFKRVEAAQFGGQSLHREEWQRTLSEVIKILRGLKQ